MSFPSRAQPLRPTPITSRRGGTIGRRFAVHLFIERGAEAKATSMPFGQLPRGNGATIATINPTFILPTPGGSRWDPSAVFMPVISQPSQFTVTAACSPQTSRHTACQAH